MKANYASGVGPWKGSLLPRTPVSPKVDANGDGKAELAGQGTGLVHPMLGWALKAGLQVHPYTLRAEETYLASTPDGITQSVIAEAVQLYSLGVQGFFIDQPDQGVAAREIFLELSRPVDSEPEVSTWRASEDGRAAHQRKSRPDCSGRLDASNR